MVRAPSPKLHSERRLKGAEEAAKELRFLSHISAGFWKRLASAFGGCRLHRWRRRVASAIVAPGVSGHLAQDAVEPDECLRVAFTVREEIAADFLLRVGHRP